MCNLVGKDNITVQVTSLNDLLVYHYSRVVDSGLVNDASLITVSNIRFCTLAGGTKLSPPVGPILAQFLSGLAGDFVEQLNVFTKPLVARGDDFTNPGVFIEKISVSLAKTAFPEAGDFAFWVSFLSRDNFAYTEGARALQSGLLFSRTAVTVLDVEQVRETMLSVSESERFFFFCLIYIYLCADFCLLVY